MLPDWRTGDPGAWRDETRGASNSTPSGSSVQSVRPEVPHDSTAQARSTRLPAPFQSQGRLVGCLRMDSVRALMGGAVVVPRRASAVFRFCTVHQ